jgi:hypothetical protein
MKRVGAPHGHEGSKRHNATSVTGGKRLALVIGNDLGPRMPFAHQDATNDMTSVLEAQEYSFDVETHTDLDEQGMNNVIDAFGYKLRRLDAVHPLDLVIFYFGGHGGSEDNREYLASRGNGRVFVDVIVKSLASHNLKKPYPIILMLDCCRDARQDASSGSDSDVAYFPSRANFCIIHATEYLGLARSFLFTLQAFNCLRSGPRMQPRVFLDWWYERVRRSLLILDAAQLPERDEHILEHSKPIILNVAAMEPVAHHRGDSPDDEAEDSDKDLPNTAYFRARYTVKLQDKDGNVMWEILNAVITKNWVHGLTTLRFGRGDGQLARGPLLQL